MARLCDVHALTDAGQTALMNAIRFKKFPEALFYLQHGVIPRTLHETGLRRTELARVVEKAKSYDRPMEPGYQEFAAALSSALAAHR